MEASGDGSTTPSPARYDTYDWYLSFPPLAALAQAVGASRWPTWRRFAEHPAYDSVWQAHALPHYFTHTTVPTLLVGGWWAQEDEHRPLATYRPLGGPDAAGPDHLMKGPRVQSRACTSAARAHGHVPF